MSKRELKKLIAAATILVLGIVLLQLVAYWSQLAEWYAEHIYRFWTETIARVMGSVPFSVGEIGLYILIVTVIVTLINAVRNKKKIPWLCHIVLTVSILFLIFVLGCGINYQRISFSENIGIDVRGYNVQELEEVCQWLTDSVNRKATWIQRQEDGQMELSQDERKEAVKAMYMLSERYSVLAGYYPKAKGILISEIFSWQGISGIYSPFTIEANYNQDMTAYNIPFTLCHELSHLRGFMDEKEANFIAFLACTESENADFQYSGYLLGWIYAMNELHELDEASWHEIRVSLSSEIEADLRANSKFWDRYEGKIEEISQEINDTYLKANGQEQGIESYDRMVDLLVAYYQSDIKNAG